MTTNDQSPSEYNSSEVEFSHGNCDLNADVRLSNLKSSSADDSLTNIFDTHRAERINTQDESESKADNNANVPLGQEAKTEKAESQEESVKLKPHPFVHWSQSKTNISLRVDLFQAEDINASIDDAGTSLEFSARGKGAHGLKSYHFKIELYSKVFKEFECVKIERYVLILIKKADLQTNWQRLTKQNSKLPWLRIDFDRYSCDGSDDSNLDSDNKSDEEETEPLRDQESREALRKQTQHHVEQDGKDTSCSKKDSNSLKDIRESGKSFSKTCTNKLDTNTLKIPSNSHSNIFDPFRKRTNKKSSASTMKYDYRKEPVSIDNSRNTAKNALDYKKTYLFLYNLGMFIMFLKLYIVLLVKSIGGKVDDDLVQSTAFIIKMLTYTQLLETIHPMLGLVPGGPLTPLTQVFGRLLVNYFLSDQMVRKDSYPYAHYLFIVWCSIEIFRYSYYALRVFNVEIYALTWCRYSLYLPLYPMGGFCESMIVMSTIKYYEKTNSLSLNLPNAANISFNLPTVLRLYVFVLLWPTIYYLMRYMSSQRTKQLNKEKVA